MSVPFVLSKDRENKLRLFKLTSEKKPEIIVQKSRSINIPGTYMELLEKSPPKTKENMSYIKYFLVA